MRLPMAPSDGLCRQLRHGQQADNDSNMGAKLTSRFAAVRLGSQFRFFFSPSLAGGYPPLRRCCEASVSISLSMSMLIVRRIHGR